MKQHSSKSRVVLTRFNFKYFVITALVAGTLDISAAVIDTYFRYGGGPLDVFRFIASGLFGRAAFSGAAIYAAAGLLFHYIIAGTWALLFFIIFPKLKIPSKYRIISGLSYGIIIWLIMNLVVLPLSNIPPHHLHASTIIAGMLYLMFCIGLTVSLLYHKLYRL